MKKLLILVLLLINIMVLYADGEVSGTIYFTDNTAVRFMNFIGFKGIRYFSEAFEVVYQNSARELYPKHLASITVKSWEVESTARGDEHWLLPTGKYEVVTNTGINFLTPVAKDICLTAIRVKILDELTGEIKEQEFSMIKRLPDYTYTLNIKQIVFNGPAVSQSSGNVLYRISRVDRDDYLNLRSKPDSESTVIAKIPYNGTQIYYLGEKEPVEHYDWYKVRYNGIEGWVNSYFLSPDPFTYVPVTGRAARGGAPLLQSPRENSAELRILVSGERVSVIGVDSQAAWAKVRMPDGVEGYLPVADITVDLEKLMAASSRDTLNNYIINVAKAVELGYDLYRTDDPYEMIEFASSPAVQETVEQFLSSGEQVNNLLNEIFTLQ